MSYKNKHLSDYSEQIASGTSREELTDWDKIPEVIKPSVQKKRGPKTRITKKTGKGVNGFYAEEVRIEAVSLYAALGNCAEVARIMNVAPTLIRKWKTLEWWELMMRRVHAEKDEELDSKFTKIVDKAVDEINDRLENGEFIYNAKTGETVRVKPKMRDVAMVAATNLEKRQLLRGQPTSRSEKVDVSDSLLRLANEFAAFTKSKDVTPEANIVEAELA
jgi:uncharacterized protein YicC (UPF0701 family)